MPKNNNLDTLTLIIPAYNEEHHIKDCLDSIACQTVMPDEVIVVNNNSSDRTVSIAKNYPFVRVINEKRQGIVYARNSGFNRAKSAIIGRIDADTVLPNNWVQTIKNYYTSESNQATAITGNGYFRNMLFPPRKMNGWVQHMMTFRFNRLILGHYILWGSNMAMLKSDWLKVKQYTCAVGDIHEDLDLAIHLHKIGIKIVYRPKLYVTVVMKRAFDNYREVWPNLMWWPRTLKRHNNPKWLGGMIGALAIIFFSLLLVPINMLLIKIQKIISSSRSQGWRGIYRRSDA